MRRIRSALALTGAIVLLAGCGGDGSGTDPTPPPDQPSSTVQAAVPTPEQLAAVLVTTDDYDGTWTVNVPPDEQAATSGVVTEAQQAMLPRIEFCEAAGEESRAAADALRWQAFRQLDQSEEDPIDMRAGDRRGHLVFVQEFLMAAEPGAVATTFEALREGMRACEGDFPASEEGPGTVEPITVSDVGDDRYAELTTMEEAGGGAYWLLNNVLVRKGPVLMSLQVVDIVMGKGVRPVVTTEDVDTFLATAVDKLP
ncbi:hypothetical protein GCM10011376_06620 [Nocardioides flavus (ex Wang et al. 2016)]|uniref:PknH-like extracellular domain-containing protein n=1 Tax=Nocardioides flavus (ex Wang et al. 2016) TaxID=2058780 RepID=A0ABQ3HHX9_9ACTN|nr:hypothetical protein [Nocardioides flavus (ex Wang et al. 2016)]GHE15955.1 hypothetical protein GCM10011376_06620 [Nocardioides flavus (ex Wang et al. 2016)]